MILSCSTTVESYTLLSALLVQSKSAHSINAISLPQMIQQVHLKTMLSNGRKVRIQAFGTLISLSCSHHNVVTIREFYEYLVETHINYAMVFESTQ